MTYDSGDYPAAFEKVLDLFEYEERRKRQQELRARGRYLGIGLANHSETYDPLSVAFAYASHACLVEVDPETGVVVVLKYAVVHDCGSMVNPLLIEGQIHGGIAQGLGGALTEEFRYNAQGQLLSDSLHQYHLPLAAGIPPSRWNTWKRRPLMFPAVSKEAGRKICHLNAERLLGL